MARKKALRGSPAGEPRQGVKVFDLLNAGSVTASLHAFGITPEPEVSDESGRT